MLNLLVTNDKNSSFIQNISDNAKWNIYLSYKAAGIEKISNNYILLKQLLHVNNLYVFLGIFQSFTIKKILQSSKLQEKSENLNHLKSIQNDFLRKFIQHYGSLKICTSRPTHKFPSQSNDFKAIAWLITHYLTNTSNKWAQQLILNQKQKLFQDKHADTSLITWKNYNQIFYLLSSTFFAINDLEIISIITDEDVGLSLPQISNVKNLKAFLYQVDQAWRVTNPDIIQQNIDKIKNILSNDNKNNNNNKIKKIQKKIINIFYNKYTNSHKKTEITINNNNNINNPKNNNNNRKNSKKSKKKKNIIQQLKNNNNNRKNSKTQKKNYVLNYDEYSNNIDPFAISDNNTGQEINPSVFPQRAQNCMYTYKYIVS